MRKTRKIVRLECHKKRAFALFATKMTRFPSAKCLFLPSRQPLENISKSMVQSCADGMWPKWRPMRGGSFNRTFHVSKAAQLEVVD